MYRCRSLMCSEAASAATASGVPNKLSSSSTQARCQSHQRFTAEDGGRLTSKTSAYKQNPPAPKAPGGSGRRSRERTAALNEPFRTSTRDDDQKPRAAFRDSREGSTRARRL